jgi:hypothetical protein
LTKNVIIGQFVVILLLVAALTGVVALGKPFSTASSPTATAQARATTGTQATNTPGTTATDTPGTAATATATPAATATTGPAATATSGVITKNLVLVCAVTPCDDPSIATIGTITIDTTLQRMVWSASIQNKLAVRIGCTWSSFKLTDPVRNQDFPGSIVVVSGDVGPGQIQYYSVTFSFVPLVGVNYIFSSSLNNPNGYPCGSSPIIFAPVTFTF